jgi:hypothetical protein
VGNPAGVRRVQKQKRAKRDLQRMVDKLMRAQAAEAAKNPPPAKEKTKEG